MPIDFRQEHQAAWARAEAKRLEEAFGSAAVVRLHVTEDGFSRGDRVVTVEDPAGVGTAGALCLIDHSEEGSFWRAELRPVPVDDDADVPDTKALQEAAFQMRYNRCVHATWNHETGPISGAEGIPDFADGAARLIRGDARIQRRRSIGGQRAAPYGGGQARPSAAESGTDSTVSNPAFPRPVGSDLTVPELEVEQIPAGWEPAPALMADAPPNGAAANLAEAS